MKPMTLILGLTTAIGLALPAMAEITKPECVAPAQPGGGCVIQMLDARIARPEAGPFRSYAATKRELAESVARLAREWAPATRVNGVAPGPVLAPEGVCEAAGDLPLGRRPTPEDVANAVAFFAESESVTGQILFVDGGQHLIEGNKP